MSANSPLPCPLCGEPPGLRPKNPEREGNAWGAVECINPDCPTFDEIKGHGVRVEDGEDVNDERGTAAYQAVAIARWNQRPREAQLKAALWPFSEFERQLGAMFNMLGGPGDHEPDDPADGEIITAANGKGAQFTLRRRHFQEALAALREQGR